MYWDNPVTKIILIDFHQEQSENIYLFIYFLLCQLCTAITPSQNIIYISGCVM